MTLLKQTARQAMKHSIKKLLLIVVSFTSLVILQSTALALGVGEIQLQSKLGQPLLATVQLSDTEDLNTDQIIVRLATPEHYRQIDVERRYSHHGLRFTIDEQKKVTITTQDDINEPYMDFILQFRWPQGSVLREFKVLIDPI